MRYTFKQFKTEYPDDDACLQAVFENRYGDLKTCPKCAVVGTRFYRVKKRQSYACMHCGYQLFPLANTIFRKTTTPLWDWFHAIYLFSVSKNGVSAKELERALGVTYKTAWRMARQIRLLMAQDDPDMLSGVVETDETYIGGHRHGGGRRGPADKEAVFGMVERDGTIKAEHVESTGARALHPRLRASIAIGSTIYSDQAKVYKTIRRYGFEHDTVNHSIEEYARGPVSTNTIEGFWSQMKRSIDGTYHAVSPKYLQHYVDEFAFRYNHRTVALFPVLVARAVRRA